MANEQSPKRWTAAEAKEILEDWLDSDLPLSTYAKGRGYGPERLRRWQQKLGVKRQRQDAAIAEAPRFVAVQVSDAVVLPAEDLAERSAGQMVIEMSSGRRLRFGPDFDESALIRVVCALETAGC
jgi:hypothetical protein